MAFFSIDFIQRVTSNKCETRPPASGVFSSVHGQFLQCIISWREKQLLGQITAQHLFSVYNQVLVPFRQRVVSGKFPCYQSSAF